MTERPPEEPDQPFEAPEGVESTEPAGDDAPSPEADLDGESIPEDLSGITEDEQLPQIVSAIGTDNSQGGGQA